jgi:hypothetical protein
MSAYLRQDRLDQEYQNSAWREDLMIERMAGSIIEDTGMLAIAISNMDEEEDATQRLADALRQFYADSELINPVAIQLRSALYGVVKKCCQSSLEKCA